MKRTAILFLITCLLAACGDDSEVFYSTTYPILRVEAVTELESAPEPEPEPEPEPGDGGGGSPTADQPVDPIVQTVNEDVLANAPVHPGGAYRLDFTVYNGGPLRVTPGPDAEPVAGEFVKQPGSREVQFVYGEANYTCITGTYTDEADAQVKVLLTVDLTEHYRALYPDAGITRVLRREYTAQTSR